MRYLVVSVIGVLALFACGGEGTSSAVSPTPSTPSIKFTMVAQNNSGVSGTGHVVKGSGSFTLTIKLSGMGPSSSHISHIHNGSCAKPGGIAYALTQVLADSAGTATVTSAVPVEYSIPSGGWYVNVHHGPDFSAPANAPSISCGDLSQA
jgi:CHRD domain-containing protein